MKMCMKTLARGLMLSSALASPAFAADCSTEWEVTRRDACEKQNEDGNRLQGFVGLVQAPRGPLGIDVKGNSGDGEDDFQADQNFGKRIHGCWCLV